jgi:hypothetical protein
LNVDGGDNLNNEEDEEDALGGPPQRVCVVLVRDTSRDTCRCGCRGGAAAAASAISISKAAAVVSTAVSAVSEDMDAYSERCDLDCECCFQDSAASLTEMMGAVKEEDLRLCDGRRLWELALDEDMVLCLWCGVVYDAVLCWIRSRRLLGNHQQSFFSLIPQRYEAYRRKGPGIHSTTDTNTNLACITHSISSSLKS